jgi:hypothetical protein
MKSGRVLLLLLLLPVAAEAQSTNAPAAPVRAGTSIQKRGSVAASGSVFNLQKLPPNEALSGNGKVSYSGIAVEVAKTHSPLQLFNPVKPPKGSTADQNAVRDPMNGRVGGLKLFAIRF